jgi:hypothetical protein
MAYRFTNTEKWNDPWFSGLDWRQKVVFLYLCDQCDMAGFYEINLRKMAWDIAIDCADVEGALKGLKSKMLYSSNGKYLYLRNFIKHQKNLPLNGNNNAHSGIINRLNENLHLFNFQSIDDYFISPSKGANEGLLSPSGNGNGNGNGKMEGGPGETGKPPEKPPQKPKNVIEVDFNAVVDLFHACCPSYPHVSKLNDTRKRKIRIRLQEMEYDLTTLESLFRAMEASKFLRGDSPSSWRASFDWVFANSTNWVKVLEGNYNLNKKNHGIGSNQTDFTKDGGRITTI